MRRFLGGLTSKIHALVNADLRLTAGQVHYSQEAEALPEVRRLRGQHCSVTRDTTTTPSVKLAERGVTFCIPSKTNHKVPIPHHTTLYQVENMFRKLKPVLGLPKGTSAASKSSTIAAPTLHVQHLHRRNRHLLTTLLSQEP